MMQCSSTCELLESYDAFILDAYGVFWSGAYVFAPAKDFMKKAVDLGKALVILSNATQRTQEEKAKYESFGLIQGVHYHALLTSGEISHELALSKKKPFEKQWSSYLVWWPSHPSFGSPHHSIFKDTPFLETQDPKKAHFIYLNTPYFKGTDQTNPGVFDEDLEKIATLGLPVLCPNPDEFAQHGDPAIFVVRQGKLARYLEKRGVDVRYIGKPKKISFDFACKKLQVVRAGPLRTLMIGDNPKTDIRGAKEVGLNSALLVETGILNHLYPGASLAEIEGYLLPEEKPTHILKSLGS